MTATLQAAAASRSCSASATTPHLLLDVGAAVERLQAFQEILPGASIHYAVKANTCPELLAALHEAGARFDVASPTEVELALAAGARSADLLYSNPVKRADHIASAHAAGVRVFVVDAHAEVDKIAREAPGAAVVCRLLTSGAGADWPLSRKYGALPDEAVDILHHAAARDLDPAGVSFHVGSQQRDPHAWQEPIADAARIFDVVRAGGFRPHVLDLGGGFPAHHGGCAPPLADYGIAIREAVDTAFGDDSPHLVLEPGRGLVGDAGVLVSSVIGIVDRGGQRWVYLDAGVFTGLVETLDEAIRYRLTTTADGPTGPCVLAGPTCDSADVLYEKQPVQLPMSLAEGDVVTFESAGAYTTCYSTVGFNGFPPLPTILA